MKSNDAHRLQHHTHLQSNLVNSKSSRLEGLFRIISSSNYRKVDTKIYNPKMFITRGLKYSLVKHKFWTRKRNFSMRRFFYTPKTYVTDSYQNIS